jgi:class 3 adenylate cyclase
VYLIGADGTLRSDPRTYLDDPTAFLDASETSGQITAAQRDEITAAGTTVLIQPAPRAALASAADGDTSVNRESSVTGSRAIAVVTPLEVSDLGWAVVSEVSPAGAESALGDFRDILIVGTSLFVIAIAFFAVAWATRIMRPVKMISERLGSIETNSEPLVIPAQSPIEMHDLAASFASMANTLERQQLTLAVAREERLGLMREMLPHAIADRLARGDLEGVDTVPQASVVVVVVLGLGELVRAGDGARDIIEQLHSELDDLADAHGLDRIKVVGDAYFAACGHDRPFIDHAPRVVAFATDARDAIRAMSRTAALGPGLDAATGVQTGAVTVGMTGGARLVYDVWGDTVTAAHQLARRAGPGTVLVSDATHSALPEEIPAAAIRQNDGTTVWSLADTVMGAMG